MNDLQRNQLALSTAYNLNPSWTEQVFVNIGVDNLRDIYVIAQWKLIGLLQLGEDKSGLDCHKNDYIHPNELQVKNYDFLI